MLYRLTLIASLCLVLTACSDAETTKPAEVVAQSASTTTNVASEQSAEPAPAQVSEPSTVNAPPSTETNVALPTVDPASCPYTAEELNQGLGLSLSIVNAMEAPFPGGSQLSCQYTGEQPITVMVNKMAMKDPALLESMGQYLADKLEAIPDDPDQAQWNAGDNEVSDLALHYVRSGASVDIRVVGFEPAELPELKTKLINLRRIP